MATLEGATDAAAHLEMAGQRPRRRGIEAEIEEPLGTLARPTLGLGDRQAVDETRGGDARQRGGARCGDEERGAEQPQESDTVTPTASWEPFVEPRRPPLYTPRMSDRALEKDLDRQIIATHRRFVKAMEGRLGTMSVASKERYFGVLSSLAAKLEAGEKSMREIMQEMMGEVASVILQEMQG